MEMKDKEKQIEEMAKEICRYVKGKLPSPDIRLIENENSILLKHSHNYGIAKELIKQGYRKLPEDAFILTDDNAEELANLIVTSPQMQSAMSDLIKAWQKETAEKILKWLKEHCDFVGFALVETYFREEFGVKL